MIKLNGRRIPEYVKVSEVEFSVLPSIQNNTVNVRGRSGLYHYGQDMSSRTITVYFTIIADKINGVMDATRGFAEWLHHTEPVRFQTDDEPNIYYMVVPDGSTTVSEIMNIGQGSVTFLCTEATAYGINRFVKFTPEQLKNQDGIAYFDVEGTAETYPTIDLTIKDSITNIAIANDEGFVQFGEPNEVTEIPTDLEPYVMNDTMSNVNRWTSAIRVDDGVIRGSLWSNGYSIGQANDDYGEGSKWHGASGIQSLPSSIDDFILEIRFTMLSQKKQSLGKIEVYTLDQNNVQFGKVGIRDLNPNDSHQKFYARAGKEAGGVYFGESWGEKRGVWSNVMEGKIRLARRGRDWSAYIGVLDEELGVWKTEVAKFWHDTGGIATNKLSKIQIFFGGYADYGVYDVLRISAVKVQKRLTLTDNQAPIIARRGDVLRIDNTKGTIYKNGEPFYEGLNPSSDFLRLKTGRNGVSVLPANADVLIRYPERWL